MYLGLRCWESMERMDRYFEDLKKKINGIGVKLDQGILRLTSKSHKVLSNVSGK